MGGNGRSRDEQLDEPQAKRSKLDDAESDSSSDSDDSDDDAPPIASSSKLPAPSLDELQDPAFVKPSIHPSRLAQDEEEDDETDLLDLPKPKKIDSVCRNWRKGDCSLGSECQYLHTVRPPSHPLTYTNQQHAAPANTVSRASNPTQTRSASTTS